jgi:hypothetical protein
MGQSARMPGQMTPAREVSLTGFVDPYQEALEVE